MPDGERYEGEWRDDKENGRGVTTWPDGHRYEGEYRDGKANGTGTATLANGSTYSGTWTNGCYKQGDRWLAIGTSARECGFK